MKSDSAKTPVFLDENNISLSTFKNDKNLGTMTKDDK